MWRRRIVVVSLALGGVVLGTSPIGAQATSTVDVIGPAGSENFGKAQCWCSPMATHVVTGPTGAGFITAYPCGINPPLASNLNYATGSTIANAVIAKIGTNGQICILNSAPTDLIIDVAGYII